MATRTLVHLEDDVDGGSADQTVSFAVNGTSYEIDLSDKNERRFEEAFQPFVAKARRVGGTAGRTARRKGRDDGSTNTEELQAIRTWAKDNGHNVSDRGRISAGVVEAYKAAH